VKKGIDYSRGRKKGAASKGGEERKTCSTISPMGNGGGEKKRLAPRGESVKKVYSPRGTRCLLRGEGLDDRKLQIQEESQEAQQGGEKTG